MNIKVTGPTAPFTYYLYNLTTGDSVTVGTLTMGVTVTKTINATVGDTIALGRTTTNLVTSVTWDGTNPLTVVYG